MFIEEIFATTTEYKAFTCVFRLLWFIKSIKERGMDSILQNDECFLSKNTR